jgi:hypothetical protein
MSHLDEDTRLNRDKYDQRPDIHPAHPGLVGALVETVLNPFFILGRR